MSMFPDKKEFVKVPKFVVKKANNAWDSYWSEDKKCWGGLIAATLYTEEQLKTKTADGDILSYDKVIGQE